LDAADHLPQFYIFLKILKEYEMGDQSAWYPWLNSLPRFFSNGSAMSHYCCTSCLPSLVGELANQERIRFTQFFRALKGATMISDQAKRNRALTKWAFSAVYTRSFPLNDRGDVLIAPLADMFNHGTQTEIEINVDEEGNCCAYTTYDVPAGSELRISYGNPTNPA